MSILFKRRPTEARSLSYQDVWGSGSSLNTIGGPDVVSGGLSLIPVYAATGLIADMIATAPLAMFRVANDGARTILPVQPNIITNPSPYGSPIDWKYQCVTSLLLRGNAYGYITQLGPDGWPSQIQWLNPDDVTVIEEQNDWFHTPTYYWRGRLMDINLVVHIPLYLVPGSVVGYSPLRLFKMQIETGLEAQKFANDWFKNSANPSGHLKNNAKELTPEQADKVKAKYKAAIANRDAFVTGSDWDYTALSIQAEESQFLQTIKATATQVAAIYRVSPEDIGGETGTSLTYKTLSQDQTKLVVRALNPIAARIEVVLSALRSRPQYAKFDLDVTAKGDRASRMTAHAVALSNGIETLDEARADEDKPPLTPEQVEQWQAWYKKSPPVTSAPDSTEPTGDPAVNPDGGSPDA